MIKKTDSKSLIFKYLILFVICTTITFIYFAINAKSFVWHVDGYDQHLVAYTYYGQWLRTLFKNIFVNHNFLFPMWDTTIGFGGDIITTFNYYVLGDPLNLLCGLCPSAYMEFLYSGLVIVRLFLAGLFFMYYAKTMNIKNNGIVVGAIIYVFTCYTMYAGVRHPFFIVPMLYLPLILAGFEKILKKERPYLFIIGVTLCVLSNFYFFYMVAIMVAIYVFVRIIYLYRKQIGKLFATLFKTFGYSLLGVLIASVLFLPIILVFIQDSRNQSNLSIPILYELKYYQKLLATVISSESGGYWNVIGISPIFLIGAYFAFAKKDVQKIALYVISVIIMLFPILGSVMNGLSYSSNRWIWAFSLLAAFTVCFYWKEIVNIILFKHKGLMIFLSIYFGIILFLQNTRKPNVLTIIVIFALMLFALSFINYFKNKFYKHRSKIIVFVVLLCIGINAFYIYSISEDNYISEFIDAGENYNSYKRSTAYDIKENVNDKDFFRFSSADDEYINPLNSNLKANQIISKPIYSGDLYVQYWLDYPSNTSSIFKRNTIGQYWSLGNINVQNFLRTIDNKEYCTFYYYGLDARTRLLSLDCVKYFITESTESAKVPYGYKKYKTITKEVPNQFRTNKVSDELKDEYKTKYNIYKNKNSLPLGYTYENTVLENDLINEDGIRKEEAMLKNAIVEKPDELTKDYKSTGESKNIKYTVKTMPDVEQIENGFLVKNKNAFIELTFNCNPDSNLYVNFKNLKLKQLNPKQIYSAYYDVMSLAQQNLVRNKYAYDSDNGSTRIFMNCNGVNKLLQLYKNNTSYYNDRTNFAVNMSYSKVNRNKMYITFERMGLYTFDSLDIVEQKMNSYKSDIKTLKEDKLKHAKIKNNKIIGDINLDRKKLLCIAIPYSDGWSLKVDGKNTEIKKVNYKNMGVVVDKGKHKIEMTYTTPGIIFGLVLSGIGILIFIVLIVVTEVSRKKT